MTPAEYLKKPYGRNVLPELDGTFRAEIIEFPGCIAVGNTAAEALANLEDVAASWLEATIAKGQRVPEPIENVGFSGKLVVRMPKTLHKKAAHLAAREGVSLNQFIVNSVAEQVGGSLGRPLGGNLQPISSVQNFANFYVQVDLSPAPPSGFLGSKISQHLVTWTSSDQVTRLPMMMRISERPHARS